VSGASGIAVDSAVARQRASARDSPGQTGSGCGQGHAGTAALIHIRGDQEGVQGLIGQQVHQDRHPGHRQPVMGSEVPGQGVFQRQVHAGAVHGQ